MAADLEFVPESAESSSTATLERTCSHCGEPLPADVGAIIVALNPDGWPMLLCSRRCEVAAHSAP